MEKTIQRDYAKTVYKGRILTEISGRHIKHIDEPDLYKWNIKHLHQCD